MGKITSCITPVAGALSGHQKGSPCTSPTLQAVWLRPGLGSSPAVSVSALPVHVFDSCEETCLCHECPSALSEAPGPALWGQGTPQGAPVCVEVFPPAPLGPGGAGQINSPRGQVVAR